MKKIRRVRTYLEQHKLDQKINLMWFFAGLVTLPAIAVIWGQLLKLPPVWLCGLAIVESISLAFLLFAYALLLDKFKVINTYLKDQNITWCEVVSEVEYSEAWDEAEEHAKNHP